MRRDYLSMRSTLVCALFVLNSDIDYNVRFNGHMEGPASDEGRVGSHRDEMQLSYQDVYLFPSIRYMDGWLNHAKASLDEVMRRCMDGSL